MAVCFFIFQGTVFMVGLKESQRKPSVWGLSYLDTYPNRASLNFPPYKGKLWATAEHIGNPENRFQAICGFLDAWSCWATIFCRLFALRVWCLAIINLTRQWELEF